ncbi:hypothetical protein GCM10023097_15670 [Streptomyces collinus]
MCPGLGTCQGDEPITSGVGMAQESHRPYPVDELLAAVRLEIAAELRSDGTSNSCGWGVST